MANETIDSGVERRSAFGRKVEVRADEGKPKVIYGYAAVYYDGDAKTEYELWDDMVERILPGAFDRAIREDDVRGLFNHDPSEILGRMSAKTMRLAADNTGLSYEIDLPGTAEAERVAEAVRRGDVTGSSFSFAPIVESWRQEENKLIRIIEEVRLYDVGPVTFPAYEATTSGTRAGRNVADMRSAGINQDVIEQARAFRARRAAIMARARKMEVDAKFLLDGR
jgi:HK97 family phage prohead protease